MQLVDQEYQLADVATLEPHPLNPNKGDVEFITASIDQTGFWGAILVQASSNCIIAGEHRWRAAQEQGAEQVPVLVLDVDDARAVEIMAMDNRARDRATWDDEATWQLLETLTQDRLPAAGFDLDDLDTLRDMFDSGPVASVPTAADPAGTTATPSPVPATSAETPEAPEEDAARKQQADAQTERTNKAQFREVPLLLTPEQHDTFIAAIQKLQDHFGTKGVVETTWTAVVKFAEDV